MEKVAADASGSDRHLVGAADDAQIRMDQGAMAPASPSASGPSAAVTIEGGHGSHNPNPKPSSGFINELPPATAAGPDDMRDVALPASSPAGSGQRHRRHGTRRSHIAPSSLAAYVASKGYFSVTELVGPTWCEFSYQYGIFGLSFLPAAERPTEVALPSGAVLRPNFVLAEKKEEIQVAGREIHKKLEEEIHPEKVYVQTKTREDDWALRLLRLIVGLRALIDGGCVRELPVFGWVQDHLVMGIIDEIERRPLAPKKPKQQAPPVPDVEPPPDQPKLPFAPPASPQRAASSTAAQPRTPIKSPSRGKQQWASQEEWKAHERKVSAAKKMAAKSKNKAKSRAVAPTSSQSKSGASTSPASSQKSPAKGTLMGFFGVKKGTLDLTDTAAASESQGEVERLVELNVAGKPSDVTPANESSGPQSEQSTQPSQTVPVPSPVQPSRAVSGKEKAGSGQPDSPRFGYFLGDTKTRLFPAIPAVVDQRAARLQTMLYKRLLDGLCLGAMRRQGGQTGREVVDSARDPTEAERDAGLLIDPDATPVDFERLFSLLNLEAGKTLSEAFLEDAQVLLEGIEPLTGRESTIGGRDEPIDLTTSEDILPGVQTLDDVSQLVDKTLIELINTARKQAGLPTGSESEEGGSCATALQTSLSLIYRLQNKKGGRWKRNKKNRQTEETDKAMPASEEKADTSNIPQALASQTLQRQSDTVSHVASAAGDTLHDDDEEAQLMLAIQMSLDSQAEVRLSGAGAEGGEAEGKSLPPSATPVKTRGRGKRRSSTSAVPAASQTSSARSSQQPRRKSRRLANARGDASTVEQANVSGERPASQVAPSQESGMSLSPASTPIAPPRSGNTNSKSTSGSEGKSALIGVVHYTHSPRLLSLHLSSILGFWLQTRGPKGVRESETWKCNGCEWREGCEWRAERGEERWREAEASRSRRQEEEERLLQVEHRRELGQLRGGEEEAAEEEGESSTEIAGKVVSNAVAAEQTEEHGGEDEDEDLWKHFDDTADDTGGNLDIEELDHAIQ